MGPSWRLTEGSRLRQWLPLHPANRCQCRLQSREVSGEAKARHGAPQKTLSQLSDVSSLGG
jgi:hypothetical protein